jgi:hypothetical protein
MCVCLNVFTCIRICVYEYLYIYIYIYIYIHTHTNTCFGNMCACMYEVCAEMPAKAGGCRVHAYIRRLRAYKRAHMMHTLLDYFCDMNMFLDQLIDVCTCMVCACVGVYMYTHIPYDVISCRLNIYIYIYIYIYIICTHIHINILIPAELVYVLKMWQQTWLLKIWACRVCVCRGACRCRRGAVLHATAAYPHTCVHACGRVSLFLYVTYIHVGMHTYVRIHIRTRTLQAHSAQVFGYSFFLHIEFLWGCDYCTRSKCFYMAKCMILYKFNVFMYGTPLTNKVAYMNDACVCMYGCGCTFTCMHVCMYACMHFENVVCICTCIYEWK